jgi:pilus assembly protein CpaF
MDPSADALDSLAAALRDRLVDAAGDGAGGDDPARRIGALVEGEAAVLDPAMRAELAARVAERALGLGPLEPLLRDPEVDEILVCGTGPVWVERGGRLAAADVEFETEAELRHVIERILAPLGRRADEAEPLCDARLPDKRGGTRQSFPNSFRGDPSLEIPALARRSGAAGRRLHPCQPGR